MEFIYQLDKIEQTAQKFWNLIKQKYPDYKIFAFYGLMGSGKTTFIQQLCKILKVKDKVVSPTFAIVNVYATEDGFQVYHFDFYRIKNLEEALNIGIEEYFDSGNYCFIEWPEIIEDLLPQKTLKIKIVELDLQTRKIEILNH